MPQYLSCKSPQPLHCNNNDDDDDDDGDNDNSNNTIAANTYRVYYYVPGTVLIVLYLLTYFNATIL